MSEIIDLSNLRLSRMTEDELVVVSIESIAKQLEDINKTLKIMYKRLYILEQTVFSPSETSPSHEEEL